jgi:4-amino-4-deoxy-L-arabinose transferase-like glycosyltransferase
MGGLIGLSILLFLLNLGNHYLWQDEAQTAVLAKTVMARGLPYGTDGKNFFSQELGAEYSDDYIWKWHTWLQFYIVAGSFKIFGTNTFAARLPFALLGIATVILLYFFSLHLWQDRRAAAAAAVLLLLCVPFLLLSRQCRYYSLSAFFSLLALFAYIRLLDRKKFSTPLFLVSGTLLFHTHYIYLGSLIVTVMVHCLLFHRRDWRRVVSVCIETILISMPWIFWLSGMKYTEVYGKNLFNFSSFVSQVISFGQQIFGHVLPIYFLFVPIIFFLVEKVWKRKFDWKTLNIIRAVSLPILFTCLTIVALSATSPAPFFRYLSPVIPPIMAITGMMVSIFYRLHWLAGIFVLIFAISQQPIFKFLYELTHDYDGPIKGIVTFLNANADPDDVVAITYGDMPLKFYTNLRIVGGLTGEDLEPAKKAKWVIIRRNVICSKDYAVRQYLIRNLDFDRYRKIEINFPDIPFENRESPYEHRFQTVKSVPRVWILERIER